MLLHRTSVRCRSRVFYVDAMSAPALPSSDAEWSANSSVLDVLDETIFSCVRHIDQH
jgi:hypothetical protein